jgi:hypothetical protein
VNVDTCQVSSCYGTGDEIALVINMETRQMEFVKNNVVIGCHSLPGNADEPVYVASSLCNSNHRLSIIKYTFVH